jgi:hypothetical protein
MAAAALAVIAVWSAVPPPPSGAPRSARGALLAGLADQDYDALLDEMERRRLPDPARPGTLLAALGDLNRDR